MWERVEESGTKRISFPWNTVVCTQQWSSVPQNITSDKPASHSEAKYLFHTWSSHTHESRIPCAWSADERCCQHLRPSITVTQSTLSARFNPISHKHTRRIIQSKQGHSQTTIYSTCQSHWACVRPGFWLALVIWGYLTAGQVRKGHVKSNDFKLNSHCRWHKLREWKNRHLLTSMIGLLECENAQCHSVAINKTYKDIL